VELGLWEPHVKRYDFTNYRQAIEALVPELKGQEDFVQYIMTDLRNRGFSRVGGSNTSFPESPGVTNMGGQFLDFVLKPEDLPK
jgi:hypothetical protein